MLQAGAALGAQYLLLPLPQRIPAVHRRRMGLLAGLARHDMATAEGTLVQAAGHSSSPW